MDENLDYQEDYQVEYDLLSNIYLFQDKKSCGGRKKSQVWDYFDTDGVRNMNMLDVYIKDAAGKEL